MSVQRMKGLDGLKGLNEISDRERELFLRNNAAKLKKYAGSPISYSIAAERIYNNQKFKDIFGLDKFNQLNDNTKASYDYRNSLLKEFIINKEASKLSPYDANGVRNNKRGVGEYWEKFNELSTDGKLKVMESEWLTPSEFENKWQSDYKEHLNNATGKNGAWRMMGLLGGSTPLTPMTMEEDKFGEAAKKRALDVNAKIFDRIYNDDTDVESNNLSPQVEGAYYSPEIVNMTDEQVKQAFIKAIFGDRSKGDIGIPEFASHYGNGSKEQITSEMSNFSIDDMREILAKRKAYYENMSPNKAATALNNEAKRYITSHQGKVKRFGLFLKDVGISSMSYTADKLNGIGEIYRLGQDLLAEKPIVYVDENNSIIDPNKVKLYQGKGGILYYQDKNGQQHSVHKEQVDYTTLHNLGKNEDGSDIEGALGTDWMTLNPQYWNRAEQFGTLDEDEQKQYEKIGSSPYKVSYNPNDEGDLWYEAFKMASFGIADGLSQLIPYGIGKIGEALSTAKKVGKVARGFGKILDGTGKLLTGTKVGQVLQGTTGALGISYAYNRGTFSETLQQNVENMEDRISNKVHNDIYNRYNSDKEYKKYIDSKVDATAKALKKEYLNKKQIEGGAKIVDMELTDKMLHAKAQDAVLAKEVANGIAEFKGTKDYANMQQRAIDGAGDAAFNTFWPEALKYGFVNNLGHRKFLYQNPAGVTRNLSQSLKGLKEITTSTGRKKLATEASKFLTRKDKLKQLGKVALSQTWGGAWTNGTDDMQVDAAERINEDSFNRYLDAWENGDAMATTYGFADGLYSYFKGLQNSLGQGTTWNAALVGGLGSIVNVTPNFANIASLFTKQGRQFYKDNFRHSIIRNEETGEPIRNEDGSIQYKNYSKRHDPLGQVNFFLQNGVLNTYYGKKQAERDLQSHADYVNNLLDEYNDFADIEKLVAANIASENLDNVGDEKTSMFLKALLAARALNILGNSSKDPTSMSSVVQNAKNLISRASELNLEEGKNPFSEEEISNLLSQYYAQNKGLEQSDENNLKALYNIAQNAQKLQEATKVADAAEKEIAKIEKNYGTEINHQVKTKMILDQALGKHWRERREKMRSEIDDTSSEETTLEPGVMIATVGGRKNAQTLVKVYNKQQAEMETDLKEQQEKTAKLQKEYEEAVKATQKAQEAKDSKAILDATNAEKEAKAKLESSQQTEKFMEDIIVMTSNKRTALQNNIEGENLESKQFKYSVANEELSKFQEKVDSLKKKKGRFFKKDGTLKKIYTDAEGNLKQKYADEIASLDKQIETEEQNVSSRTELVNKYKEKVLTADEIFALDPVTRARMMRAENRSLYSKEQQREIEKLEQKLLIKDADALQKIQDIGLLTQRINSVEDAYTRMAKHPEAAAYEVENQRVAATNAAAKLINQRSAETLAGFVNQMSEALKVIPDISQAEAEQNIYEILRKHNSHILDIIDEDNLLPNYAQQLKEAKEWAKVVEDIDAVIESMEKTGEEKASLRTNIDRILKDSNSKEEIMSTLEKVVDDVDNPNAVKDFEQILEGMEKLDYQRDSTILESRKQRIEREVKEREKREEEQRRKEEEARAAAEIEAEKRKAEEEAESIMSNENLDESSLQDVDLDLGEEGNKGNEEEHLKEGQPKEGTKVTVAKAVRKHKYTPIGGTEMEIDVEENRVPLNELQAGDQYFGGNNVIYEVEKVLNDGRVLVHPRDDKKRGSLIDPKDFENTELMWAKGGVDRIVKEETPQIEEQKKNNIIDNGEEIYVRSETIEEQLQEELPSDKKAEIHTTDEGKNAETENTAGQQGIETNPIYLSGTAMPEFNHQSLAKDGVLERRKGKEPSDPMNKYFNWMKAAGIKLQNITDQELARIIKVNPHAKVKFMVIRPDNNATHDYDMKNHLLLVLDYDNSINKGITSIHNKDNGGIIESRGKKYLVIGTVGYGKGNIDKLALYDILYGNNPNSKTGIGIVRRQFSKFFNDNPTERYYVNEELSTEIVPNYPTPGYIVRQMEMDDSPKFRSIIELLASDERNPMHLELESMAWGIQEKSKFMLIGTTLDRVMTLRDPIGNQGSAFALIPASNGKMLPIYLKVLKYAEMREGSLMNKINNLLQDVTSPNYQKRLDAVVALGDIFYFSKEGDFILLRKSKDEISLVHDGKAFKTFNLGSDFDRMEFMKAFEDMNPRVNITAKVLGSIERLKEYDEAGALMTDAALLATAGSSYSIYGLDAQGNMIKPTIQENNTPSTSDFKEKERSQIVYKYNYYREADGVFYLDGKPVTDENTNRQLNIIKRILDNGLASVESKGVFDYYILSNGEHPEVVKINRNTKEVKELEEEEAKILIKNVEEKKDKEKREQTAKDLMEKAKNGTLPIKDAKDVELETDEDFIVDPETGEIITPPANNSIENNEENVGKVENEKENTISEENNTPKNIPPVNSRLPKEQTQTFQQLMKSRHSLKVLGITRKKWKDAPKDMMDLENFLREKGIQVDAIGTSENDIKTWIKTLEDCR